MKNNSSRKWIALGLLIIASASFNQAIIENKLYQSFSNRTRDLIDMALLIIYTAIGYWGLMKSHTKWVKKIWLYFYVTVIVLFVAAAFIDWFIYHYSTKEQFRFVALKQLLWGPIPYLLTLTFDTLDQKKGSRID